LPLPDFHLLPSALPPKGQIALTLREVCGLTTEEIAHAFLVTPAAIAQRIARV
jgi:RNA polymerase sigma-70 factor, ECF subfamily